MFSNVSQHTHLTRTTKNCHNLISTPPIYDFCSITYNEFAMKLFSRGIMKINKISICDKTPMNHFISTVLYQSTGDAIRTGWKEIAVYGREKLGCMATEQCHNGGRGWFEQVTRHQHELSRQYVTQLGTWELNHNMESSDNHNGLDDLL